MTIRPPSPPRPPSSFRGRTGRGGVPTRARHLPLTFLIAAGALIAACSSGHTKGAALDPFLCTQEDLGDGYQLLTDGSFSPGDLADLGPGPRDREREFREAGMLRGKFVLFNQVLPRPPFDPPVNVVCQVLEFVDGDEAQAFVTALKPDGTLTRSLIGSLPGERLVVREGAEETEGDPRKPREFTLVASDGDHSQVTFVVLRSGATGRYVRTVAAGITGDRAAQDLGGLVNSVWLRSSE